MAQTIHMYHVINYVIILSFFHNPRLRFLISLVIDVCPLYYSCSILLETREYTRSAPYTQLVCGFAQSWGFRAWLYIALYQGWNLPSSRGYLPSNNISGIPGAVCFSEITNGRYPFRPPPHRRSPLSSLITPAPPFDSSPREIRVFVCNFSQLENMRILTKLILRRFHRALVITVCVE